MRRYAFYYRYDTSEELVLLNQLWPLVNMKLNHFTVTRKPIGYKDQRNKHGKKIRIYDKPATPWQRLKTSGVLDQNTITRIEAQRASINPADLTREINQIQQHLIALAQDKTRAVHDRQGLDLTGLETSIQRLATKP